MPGDSDHGEQPEKPSLHLLNPRTMTFEDVTEMFRVLTGREPTEKDMEKSRKL